MKKQLIPVLVITLLLALGLGGVVGYTAGQANAKRTSSTSPTQTPSPTQTIVVSQSPTSSPTVTLTPTPAQTSAPIVSTTPTKVAIGKAIVAIPNGWYISSISANSENMTKEEQSTFLKSDYANIGGLFPIFKKAQVIIAKSTSQISLTQNSEIIAGPFGIVPEDLPKNFTVISKPTKSVGGAARQKIGNTYTYYSIFLCDGACTTQYGYTSSGFGVKMTFTGSSSDLATADAFYKANLMNKQFSFEN